MSQQKRPGPSRRSVILGGACGGALAVALGHNVVGRAEAPTGGTRTLPMGMNLAGIADWEPGYPFRNLMWGARVWLTRNAQLDGPWDTKMAGFMEMDADGYPLEVPFRPERASDEQHVFTMLPSAVAKGRYVILYDGEGEVGTGGGTKIIDAKPGRIEVSMEHRGIVVSKEQEDIEPIEEIWIRRSVRGNHIRNIRILPIADEKADLEANPFREELLEFCKPWHCLRFMDWQVTNNSISRNWADRKKRSFYTQVSTSGDVVGMHDETLPPWQQRWSSGVALELCVQLANITKIDPWLCVPHLADDEYIAQMARLVKDTLDPELKVYVEFSNELWNWQFGQAQWVLRSEMAGDLVAAVGDTPPWKGGVKPNAFAQGIVKQGAGEGTDHLVRIAALMRRCFKIWEEVFSGADRKRLVRVCAVQGDWIENASHTLDWVMKHGGCDALSPGGYFGPDEDLYKLWDQKGAGLTPEDVIADMKLAIARSRRSVRAYADAAKRAGVRLVIYEGGQHLQTEGQVQKAYNPALGAVQKDPAIYDLYRQHLDQYASAGCDLFCAFSSIGPQGSRFGSWGHAEFYGQNPDDMPKYKAILEANMARSVK